MQIPAIPTQQLIQTSAIPQDPEYQNLRIVRCQSNEEASQLFRSNAYQFQHDVDLYTPLRATLCRKGAKQKYRLVATVHPRLRAFTELVRYDPSDPPNDDYEAQGMKQAHDQTQSDFKGQKKANTADFRNYIVEGFKGHRTVYLPVISGWQSKRVFERTVFVAFDESEPNAMYGLLYLPKAPIMQADGQTQTAALFQAAKTVDAHNSQALDTLMVTLEIELNVSEMQAGQSFADRNGRGSKKNKNLVIGLDTSSALSTLRMKAAEGTIFEGRMANGRSTSTSATATKYIVDLSTMEQMLLNVIAAGRTKPERFKYHYVDAFLPFFRDFLLLLEEQFGAEWPELTPANRDPYRKLYVHGWPFCLKALALAYHRVRIHEIGPLAAAMGTEREVTDASKSLEEKFALQIARKQETHTTEPVISYDEFKDRLSEIDWFRYRRHWIALTGCALKDGHKKAFKLRESGEEKVVALAQNTPAMVESVCDKILSSTWTDLCEKVDEPLSPHR